MIELKNISKTYSSSGNSVEAVKDVTLTINDSDIFGIIGFSGAGKSTLVRCINLLERPTSGQVLIDGKDITKFSAKELRAARKKIGMIFQHFNLMPSRTVLDNVIYALKGSGISKSEMREKALRLLEHVEIADKAEMYPNALSGGQKQRVAIARALANDPKILLCDEATSALDPQTTKQILALLKSLNETLGITIVLITHEMAAVKEICNRTAVMDKGNVIELNDTFSVFADPQKALTKDFIATTSNLKKIHELLSENPDAVPLDKDDIVVKLTYTERSVSEPLISAVTQKFGVLLNIVFADVDIVQGAPIGGTVAVISGDRGNITEAVKYLIEKNVAVEVIKNGMA
ncbi:MAG: ATP-binding cassette domain-containing protein [Oscillospiraceae bacterium]|nr:ATP-binding cassette domain-containing protein [Oscillospiraceae bacterium]